MTHIFDLDNTLVYTDQANHDAYNEALQQEGLKPIALEGRITRETVWFVYPNLTNTQIQRIIASKQMLFPLEKTFVNAPLLQYAKEQGRDDCLIWSGADYGRIRSLMKYYGLDAYFFDIYSSKKSNIVQEFEELSRRFSIEPQDVIVYEDTNCYIEELRRIGVKTIDVKFWSPKGATSWN